MKLEDEDWTSPVGQHVVEMMRSRNLTLVGFRDRKGHLRHVLDNNEIVSLATVKAMLNRGLLEQVDRPEAGVKLGEVHYRLRNP